MGCGQAVEAALFHLALGRLDQVLQDLFVRGTGLGRHRLGHQRRITGGVDQRHRVLCVLDLPTRWRSERKTQTGVIKILAAHHALLGAVAVDHAADRVEVALAAIVAVAARCARVASGDVADAGQPLIVARVRGQPVATLARLAAGGAGLVGGKLLLHLQHRDHVDHVLRVVAVAHQVFGAQLVGLQFLVAAVAGDVAGRRTLRRLPGQLAGTAHTVGLGHRAQHAGGQHADAGGGLAGGAGGAVAGGHMTDFMADHACQVGLAFHVGHDAARHIDIAAGQREGVDLGAVEHGEGPLQVGAMRFVGQLLAQIVDVGLQFCVLDRAVLLQHTGMGLAPFGDLGLLVHHAQFALAGHRVGDAGAGAEHQAGDKRWQPEVLRGWSGHGALNCE